ncbi:MAG: multifunctional CCA tRNA nucleotidyl transferase/2'3'-cyclic phosphodiesterase/2'nucleotidase/phosphatase [Burkholderiaceae bacterium]
MRIYRVGGSVRDELLGLPVKDRDWVVVGATVAQMGERGYRQVGRDFPVFLHPRTHEEYALARTERKSAPGYRGFVVHADPDVTIEQDLARRDLTINAIAIAEDGSVVDPFGGRADLQARVLRHVGDAFVEDPLRVLRLARFAARFDDFSIADATRELMRRMTASGELSALVAERIWQELARGLMEKRPSRMIAVLQDVGAWPALIPECPAPDLAAVDRAAAADLGLPVRFVLLAAGLDPVTVERLCARLRAPNDCRELAMALARVDDLLPTLAAADAETMLRFLSAVDALRRPQRLVDLVAVEAARARLPDFERWRSRIDCARQAAAAVDQAAIAARATHEQQPIRDAIVAAQVAAISAALEPDRAGEPADRGPLH